MICFPKNGTADRKRAFTLVEIVIAMVVVMMIGVVVFTSLFLFFNSYAQSRDYVVAREAMEFAFWNIDKEFTNIGLGLPNNRTGNSDFSNAFRAKASPATYSPLMYHMGAVTSADWGGPIMLAKRKNDGEPNYTDTVPGNTYKVATTVTYEGAEVYAGNEILYTWTEPVFVGTGADRTPVKVDNTNVGRAETDELFVFPLLRSTDAPLDALINFRFPDSNTPAGIAHHSGTSELGTRNWVAFPNFHLPLRVEGWETSTGTKVGTVGGSSVKCSLTLRTAPGATLDLASYLSGFEEVRLVKSARIFLNKEGQLLQEIYGDSFATNTGDASVGRRSSASIIRLLAEDVADVRFIYNKELRSLTMFLAMAGHHENLTRQNRSAFSADSWPNITGMDPLPAEYGDGRRRVIVGQRTWRIRN